MRLFKYSSYRPAHAPSCVRFARWHGMVALFAVPAFVVAVALPSPHTSARHTGAPAGGAVAALHAVDQTESIAAARGQGLGAGSTLSGTTASGALSGTASAPSTAAEISTLATDGIPLTALTAYKRGADYAARTHPGCGITWPLLAAIGRVESDHGRFAGAALLADGTSSRKVIGIPLDGHGTSAISDTDHGRLDGDTVYDRAVGPMQFIPSTWAAYGTDGNGDGIADPFNVFDAAPAAADYLCAAGGDLTTLAGQTRAVLAYNHSEAYLETVLGLEKNYAAGVPGLVAPTGPPITRPTPVPPVPPVDPGPPRGLPSASPGKSSSSAASRSSSTAHPSPSGSSDSGPSSSKAPSSSLAPSPTQIPTTHVPTTAAPTSNAPCTGVPSAGTSTAGGPSTGTSTAGGPSTGTSTAGGPSTSPVCSSSVSGSSPTGSPTTAP